MIEMTNESYANGESSLGEVFVSDEDEVPTGDLLQLDTPSSIKPNRAVSISFLLISQIISVVFLKLEILL